MKCPPLEVPCATCGAKPSTVFIVKRGWKSEADRNGGTPKSVECNFFCTDHAPR